METPRESRFDDARRTLRAAAWGSLSLLALMACSITGDDLAPKRIAGELDSNQPASSPEAPGQDAVGVGEDSPAACSAGELGGCDLPLSTRAKCASNADCLSDRCDDGRCAAARCDDGARNQNESDVDCGGDCGSTCVAGRSCLAPGDCQGSLVCVDGTCAAPSCADGTPDGRETDVDCGGDCPGCADLALCTDDSDCQSGYCDATGRCATPTCGDDEQNQNESDVDCGGDCGASCRPGQRCDSRDDCESGVCSSTGCGAGVQRCCQAASCEDGVRNGSEPVPDCGNDACGLCPLAATCADDGHCDSGLCGPDGRCAAPPCADGQRGGDESDVDCGGSDCRRCEAGARCNEPGDCASGSCVGGVCTSCNDGVRNGNETDVDCGGACGDCNPGQSCAVDGDCSSLACEAGRCCGGRERDCTRCAERLAPGRSCDEASDPNAAANCRNFLGCLAQNEICSVRHGPGCSEDPGGVCNHLFFGGNGSPGLALADSILGSAQCLF